MKSLISTFLVVLISSFTFAQTTWYVDVDNSGTQNGQSWSTAFNDLQEAIDSSSMGDSIFIAGGTYFPSATFGTLSSNRDQTFIIKSGVKMYGGFDGTESSLNDRGFDSTYIHVTNPTVLSGDIGTTGDTTDNCYHVVMAYSSVSGTSINDLAIEHGNADGTDTNYIVNYELPQNYGGGIFSLNSELTLDNVIIRENLAERGGGGAMHFSGDNRYTNSVFENNRLNGDDGEDPLSGGGAVRNFSDFGSYSNVIFRGNLERHAQGGGAMRNESFSDVEIFDCLFTENISIDGDGGAGIYCATNSDPVIINTSFTSNSTSDQGGGMYCDNSIPELTDCLFRNNEASGGAGAMENDGGSHVLLTRVHFIGNQTNADGGAIQNWKSSPIIEDCVFENNQAGNDGGGLFNYNDCSPWVTDCIFKGNQAVGNGGGIYNRRNCNPVITNTLIYDNAAMQSGGGIYTVMSNSAPCSPIATNVTITENQAAVSGGGAFDDGEGDSKVRNAIIYNNNAPTGEDVEAPASLLPTAVFHVIIGAEYYDTGSNPPIPVSGALFVNAFADNFRLGPGSQAIDLGDESFYANTATPDLSHIIFDLEGKDRFMGPDIDLGAYESCSDTTSVSASISVSPSDTIIETSIATFTSTTSGGGQNGMLTWYVNSTPHPSTLASITLTEGVDFVDNDSVRLRLISDLPCVDEDTVWSNTIVLKVIADTTDTGSNDTTPEGIARGAKPKLTLYPNPVRSGDRLTLSTTEYNQPTHVSLVDLVGREVFSTDIPAQPIVLIPNFTAPGTYILQLRYLNGDILTRRISVYN